MDLKKIAIVTAGVFAGQLVAPYVIGMLKIEQDPTSFGLDDLVASVTVAATVLAAIQLSKSL